MKLFVICKNQHESKATNVASFLLLFIGVCFCVNTSERNLSNTEQYRNFHFSPVTRIPLIPACQLLFTPPNHPPLLQKSKKL